MYRHASLFAAILFASSLAGCQQNICADAAEHFAQCTGRNVQALAGCDQVAAQQLLASSCDAIGRSGGKADDQAGCGTVVDCSAETFDPQSVEVEAGQLVRLGGALEDLVLYAAPLSDDHVGAVVVTVLADDAKSMTTGERVAAVQIQGRITALAGRFGDPQLLWARLGAGGRVAFWYRGTKYALALQALALPAPPANEDAPLSEGVRPETVEVGAIEVPAEPAGPAKVTIQVTRIDDSSKLALAAGRDRHLADGLLSAGGATAVEVEGRYYLLSVSDIDLPAGGTRVAGAGDAADDGIARGQATLSFVRCLNSCVDGQLLEGAEPKELTLELGQRFAAFADEEVGLPDAAPTAAEIEAAQIGKALAKLELLFVAGSELYGEAGCGQPACPGRFTVFGEPLPEPAATAAEETPDPAALAGPAVEPGSEPAPEPSAEPAPDPTLSLKLKEAEVEGTEVTLRGEICNTGAVDAAEFKITIRYHPDEIKTRELSQQPLAASECRNFFTSVKGAPAGSYTVTLSTPFAAEQPEATFAVQSDLYVAAIMPTVAADGTVGFQVRICNRGATLKDAPVRVGVFKDREPSCGDIPDSNWEHTGLEADHCAVTDLARLDDAEHTISVLVDHDCSLEESDETNNTLSRPFKAVEGAEPDPSAADPGAAADAGAADPGADPEPAAAAPPTEPAAAEPPTEPAPAPSQPAPQPPSTGYYPPATGGDQAAGCQIGGSGAPAGAPGLLLSLLSLALLRRRRR